MEFRTLVDLPRQVITLEPRSRLLFMGSCFAEHVGTRAAAAFPEGHVIQNPFGVLYNPESLRLALEILLYGSLFFPDEYLFQGADGLWHSWLHSGAYSDADRDACAAKVRASYDKASQMLRQADLLCITFGTNHVYEHRERGFVVGNCHKEPAATFSELTLSVEEIAAGWGKLLSDLRRECPGLRVVFTVSPYRYAKYGFHASQLAKATLLLAVERLASEHDNACYFPAYEIMMDELRDYRFYAEDMLHPSGQAADYIWERFAAWSFSSEMQEYVVEKQALRLMEGHRPLHPGSEEHQRFLLKLERRREAFKKRWASF